MTIPQVVLDKKQIILFDGVCNLCSGFMHFVSKRDPEYRFKFAWLQDASASQLLKWLNQSDGEFKTIIYIEEGQVYYKSTAVLKIFSYLRFPWPILKTGYVLPLGFRDWIYDLIAATRYRWFGKKESCQLPDGDLKNRFL